MTNGFVSKPQGPNLVSPNGYEGGFELGGQNVFFHDPGDVGAMTLNPGQALPPGWQPYKQIQWLSNNNTRGTFGAPTLRAAEGSRFLDLTSNGHNLDGGVVALITTKLGRSYEVSLSLGTNENAAYTSGPVQVTVQAIGRYASGNRLLGQLVFRNERGRDGAGMVWVKHTDVMEIALDPQEEAAEEVVQRLDEALRALGISPPHNNTWFLIFAKDLSAERKQNPAVMDSSDFVGLDDVSVREMGLSLLDTLRLDARRVTLTVLQMIGLRRPR